MIRVYGYLGDISERLRHDALQADLVVGGRRHLDALSVPNDRRFVLGGITPAIDAIKVVDAGKLVVVVASGDPLLFGVVRRIRQAGLVVEVVPEVSSLQAAFAAVALPWDDAQLVSAHAQGIEAAVQICRTHPKVGVLTAPGQGIGELAAALHGAGKTFVLAERLGESDQRVRVLTADQAEALGEDVRSPHVVLVLASDPASPQALGTSPQLQGDANALGPGEPAPGANTNPDGTDRTPIIGQIVNSDLTIAHADAIDAALGVASKRYAGPAARGLVAAWGECDLIIAHLALGATTRLIAPLLTSKKTDPGVVVVDEAGTFAVPLVGGHTGGANQLARRIGEAIKAQAVITTATDALGIPALDQLGWAFSGDVAVVTGAIISGRPVLLCRDQPWILPPLPANLASDAERPVAQVMISDRLAACDGVGADELAKPHDASAEGIAAAGLPTVLLRPPSLVVGMGCNKGTNVDALHALLTATVADAGLAIESVSALASADVKAGELGLIKLAHRLGVDYRTYPAEVLAAQNVPNPSQAVLAEVGTGSVAEAAVLACGAELVVPKHKTPDATCAVGRLPVRGRLHVVGLGPGARDLLSPRAEKVIRSANQVVGYAPYVRQIRDLISPYAQIQATKMGAEQARISAAIKAARGNLDVAFVCGGDPAIYAMASPTFEVGTHGIDVDVVPGITAELAASAILGAPLGHDHATISLSDLHTDWDLICQRVRAAAQGDFVITFYNPRSRTRLHHLPDALAIVAEYRDPSTPVAMVAQAERLQQQVRVSTLKDFRPEWVDMNTLVIVGSSTSKAMAADDGRPLMVTPRDYHWMNGRTSGDNHLNYHHSTMPKADRATYRGLAKHDRGQEEQ